MITMIMMMMMMIMTVQRFGAICPQMEMYIGMVWVGA